jgi:hypothetical protein
LIQAKKCAPLAVSCIAKHNRPPSQVTSPLILNPNPSNRSRVSHLGSVNVASDSSSSDIAAAAAAAPPVRAGYPARRSARKCSSTRCRRRWRATGSCWASTPSGLVTPTGYSTTSARQTWRRPASSRTATTSGF